MIINGITLLKQTKYIQTENINITVFELNGIT